MNFQKFPELEFNTGAKVITTLLVVYLGVVIFGSYFFGSLFTVTTSLQSLMGALANFAEAFVGLNSARLFGGERNFTGRLLLFYSAALFSGAFSWLLWSLYVRGQIPPTGSMVEILLGGAILGHIIAGFALFISAKALIQKVSKREIVLVVYALMFSLALSAVTGFSLTSLIERIVWSGIWSMTIFLQLGSGLVLVSLLGKWYVARRLTFIAFGYLGFSIITPIVIMMQLATHSFSLADGWLILSVAAALTNYIVGLTMSQVRPMKKSNISLKENFPRR